jgi:hypothetical protein
MKLYLAAVLYNDFRPGSTVYNRLDEREKRAVEETQHILDSYHYIGNERMVKRLRDTGRQIFLDSGAFSAFTQGVTINLKQYCHYILRNMDLFEVISVLDAIGDYTKPETLPPAATQTYNNLKAMEQMGVYALPCYHYGEPEQVLEYYAENYEYITIGGMVPISSPQLKVWLDRIWGRYLTNEDGTPKVKVHGFGLTSVPLMARYPWYSVDSSSWVQLGGMGNVFLPEFGTIAVSEHAPQLKQAEKHIDNLPKEHQDVVVGYIEDLGFDMDRLRTNHLSRKTLNMVTYGQMMGKQIDNKKFIPTQPVLF